MLNPVAGEHYKSDPPPQGFMQAQTYPTLDQSVNISMYSPNLNSSRDPSYTNPILPSRSNNLSADSGGGGSTHKQGMYDRNDNNTNTATTDVNDVSMKIDFSDIFRDSTYTHDSTTWTQCLCNIVYYWWEFISCKELDVRWYKRFLIGVLFMNLCNMAVEIGGLMNEINGHHKESGAIAFEMLYSFGLSIAAVNCLLIVKLIYRPTTRSALISSSLIMVLFILDTVQLATYRHPEEIRDAITISLCALFLFFQAASAILLYRYWEFAMFHFDDHANLRELFLDNSGQYDSSNTKYFDDLNAVSKQKGSHGSGSAHVAKDAEKEFTKELDVEEQLKGGSIVHPHGANITTVAGTGGKQPTKSNESHNPRSFSYTFRNSFTYGAAGAPPTPAAIGGSQASNVSTTPRNKKLSPRATRSRASMLSNHNINLHNSLLQQQQLSPPTTNVNLTKFFNAVDGNPTATTAPSSSSANQPLSIQNPRTVQSSNNTSSVIMKQPSERSADLSRTSSYNSGGGSRQNLSALSNDRLQAQYVNSPSSSSRQSLVEVLRLSSASHQSSSQREEETTNALHSSAEKGNEK